MAKNAFVLRRITDSGAGLHYPARAVIKNMAADQFESWRKAGLVREATDAEIGGKTPAPTAAEPMSERAIANPPPEPKKKRRRKAS